nr:MATE family efflux transporter [uncultured Oscillibacter sp.]
MTQGREWRQLLFFALPMMGAQLLQVAYSIADAVIVGNFVSAQALGAVSVPGPILWIASSIASGMGAGTNIIIAQYFGARQHENIRSSAISSVWLGGAAGLAVTLLCIVSARPLLQGFLHTPPEMLSDASAYLTIYSIGFLFQMLYHIFYGITRAFGDSRAALLFLLVAAMLNVVLDLFFVAGLGMGAAGVALASTVSQAGSALAALLYLLRKFPQLRPSRQDWRPQREKLALVLRFSGPVTLQMTLQAAGFLLLQRLVNSFGPASIEGFAAMGKTEELIHIPVNCMASALASFVGQNIGAGQIERARKGCRAALAITLGAALILGTGMLMFDRRILGFYNITADALLRGTEHLDVMCILLPVFTVQQVINGALQGAGDVQIPVVSSFTDLVLRLAGAKLLSLTALSFRSIYLSSPPAWIIACLISVIRYRQGTWAKQQLTENHRKSVCPSEPR